MNRCIVTCVHNFICDLAKAVKEIMEIVEAAYPGQGLSSSQVYRLIKCIKEGKDTTDKRGKDTTKTFRTADFIESMKAEVEADRRITVEKLATNYEVSSQTIWNVYF